jgi:hypothetical protein
MVSKAPSRGTRLSVIAVAAAVLAAAFPALASAGCPQSTLSQPFAQFGDKAWYMPAPGGSFETGAPDWSLSRSSVADGNESYNVAGGTHSLTVGLGGVASSPWFCISSEFPTFRFFARQLGGASASPLNVSLRWIDVLGVGVDTGAGSLRFYGAWTPSPVMRLASALPLWMPGSTLMVRLQFQAGTGGSWAIDDVYLDPYRR